MAMVRCQVMRTSFGVLVACVLVVGCASGTPSSAPTTAAPAAPIAAAPTAVAPTTVGAKPTHAFPRLLPQGDRWDYEVEVISTSGRADLRIAIRPTGMAGWPYLMKVNQPVLHADSFEELCTVETRNTKTCEIDDVGDRRVATQTWDEPEETDLGVAYAVATWIESESAHVNLWMLEERPTDEVLALIMDLAPPESGAWEEALLRKLETADPLRALVPPAEHAAYFFAYQPSSAIYDLAVDGCRNMSLTSFAEEEAEFEAWRRDLSEPHIDPVRVRGLAGTALVPTAESSDLRLFWHEEGVSQRVTVTLHAPVNEAAIDDALARAITYAEAFEIADDQRLFTFLVDSFEGRHFWGPIDSQPDAAPEGVQPAPFPGC